MQIRLQTGVEKNEVENFCLPLSWIWRLGRWMDGWQ
jgi:hypothetical protein